jgi:hypothetical protein
MTCSQTAGGVKGKKGKNKIRAKFCIDLFRLVKLEKDLREGRREKNKGEKERTRHVRKFKILGVFPNHEREPNFQINWTG